MDTLREVEFAETINSDNDEVTPNDAVLEEVGYDWDCIIREG